MSELQDLYESINPIPENLSRCGDGYCQHVYMLIDPYASGYKARFEGFKQGLQHQQSKVDELQKKNAWLSGVACRENKRANKLQEEKVSTTTLLGKTIQEKNELQKRVDAAKYYMKNIFSGDAEVDQCHLGDMLDILDGKIVDEIEQALKGGCDE